MLTRKVILPEPIYKAIPYLYLIFGTLALLGSDPIYGKVAGLILVVASIVVSFKRQPKC
jgi:hypothetical protein